VHAYVIDSGIRFTHQEFGGRASPGVDLVGDGGQGRDCIGHGTHVAGILGGTTYGVAKSVQLVSVRVMNCSGLGSLSAVIAGVDWVTINATKPAVANMSISGESFGPLDDAIEASIASGVTYAVAAGNDSSDACGFSPASAANALVVAATSSTDVRAPFSNYGPCVELFAPGVAIPSSWYSSDSSTASGSGTSMATPHVAGAAALYLDAHPTASSAEVANALVSTSTPNRVASPGAGSPNRLAFTGGTLPGEVIAAAGSSATKAVMRVVMDGADRFDVAARQAPNLAVPADGFCGAVTYGIVVSATVVSSPNGSIAGRDALAGSVAGTFPNGSTGSGQGCVDVARSVEGPRAVGAGGDNASFEYYAFGLDAVAWASPSLNAPVAMTLQDLRDVYACDKTDWSQVGGAPGPIQRFVPTAGSEERTFFSRNVLGLAADPGFASEPAPGPGLPACPAAIVIGASDGRELLLENDPDGAGPLASNSALYQRAIMPYSASRFVFQATNRTNPTLDHRSGVRIGGLVLPGSVRGANAVHALRWTGSDYLLNNATVNGTAAQVQVVPDAQTTGSRSPLVVDATVSSASAGFEAGDVGSTLEGSCVSPGTVITRVLSSSEAMISPGSLSSDTACTLWMGPAVVGEKNPQADIASTTNIDVMPGVRFLYNVIDSTAPGYVAARDLVGFDPTGIAGPLCSGAHESIIATQGFLPLTPVTVGPSSVVVCRIRTPT